MCTHDLRHRNWGQRPGVEFKNLHFELCYYQVRAFMPLWGMLLADPETFLPHACICAFGGVLLANPETFLPGARNHALFGGASGQHLPAQVIFCLADILE